MCCKRSKAVPFERFIRAVFSGKDCGKTQSQVACELGMKKNAFYVRLNQIRREIRQGTIQLGSKNKEKVLERMKLKTEQGRRVLPKAAIILKNL